MQPEEVADHWREVGNRRTSRMSGDQRGGGDDVDAGDRHQPAHVLVAQRVLGDDLVDLRELAAEEVQLAQAAVDVQALIDGQLPGGDPRAALLAERVASQLLR